MSTYHDMYRVMYGEMPEEHKADFERMIEQEEAFHRRVVQLCLSGGLSYEDAYDLAQEEQRPADQEEGGT